MIPKQLKKYNPEYLASGKRSDVYTFKNYAIKVLKSRKEIKDKIKNEAKFLKILNKYNIGPILIKQKDNYMIYEFVKGKTIKQLKKKKKDINNILKQILKQCRTLDKLKINKKEMHHPLKHILIYRNKATMIDFERCYYTEKPKNITQFCQFMLNFNLVKDKIKFKKAAQEYKKEQSNNNFRKIFSFLK